MGTRILFIPPNRIERWLNKVLINNEYLYIDRWSFVYLGSGVLLGYILNKYSVLISRYINIKHPFLVVLIALIAYELFEIMFWGSLFKKESLKNIFWDLVIGMIGFTIYWLRFRK